MEAKKIKTITLEDLKMLLEALKWENPMIETIVSLSDQGKATRYHGMVLVAISFGAFVAYRFCSKIARKVLRENGMPEDEINFLVVLKM